MSPESDTGPGFDHARSRRPTLRESIPAPEGTADPVAAEATTPDDDLTAWLKRARAEATGASGLAAGWYGIRLVAAVEDVLKLHVQAAHHFEDPSMPPFRYCRTCSGHPKWPCPEVEAISAGLLGEGSTGA